MLWSSDCVPSFYASCTYHPPSLPPPPRRCHMRGRSVIYAPRLKVRNIFPYKGVAIQGKFHCDVTAPTRFRPFPHSPPPTSSNSSSLQHLIPIFSSFHHPHQTHPTMSTLSAKNVESTARQRGHSAMVCCPGSHQPYSTFVLALTTSFSYLFTLIPTHARDNRTSNPLPPVSPPRP